MKPILSATSIVKRFGPTLALDEVSIELRAGEIHAIVGENGAGKSTLARILAGVAAPDRGEVVRSSAEPHGPRPLQRLAEEVGYLPQRAALVADLSLIDHCILSDFGWWADRRGARLRLAQALDALGTELPFEAPCRVFDVVQRQLGALALALARGARVLLLDEPTAAFGPVEIERLQRILRRLADSGTAVGLVTHRIAEVLGSCDRMTVLREGRLVHHSSTAGVTAEALGAWMVGTRVTTAAAPAPLPESPVRLTVQGIGLKMPQAPVLEGIDLRVRGGELVGLAGVGGSGQTALAEIVAGLVRPTRGRVLVDGIDVTGDPRKARSAGLAFIPEDRADGLSLPHSVAENLALFRLGSPRGRWLQSRNRDAERRHAADIVAQLSIVPTDVNAPVATLSGGNQQKVVVGRELEADAAAIVAHGPTRGLDLAAAAAVRDALFAAAARGAAVLVLSADLDELFALCGRLLVLSGGRLVAEFDCRAGPPEAGDLGRALSADAAFHSIQDSR